MKKGKWYVRKTGFQAPDYPYEVVRELSDGTFELYQYADSRKDAQVLAKQANAMAPR
jgi:hypothetical protein